MMFMEKKIYDMRGSQVNILRLLYFDKEAFIHMLFYRILMFASVLFGFLLLLSLIFNQLSSVVKLSVALVWILFTPQIFAMSKGVSMMLSNGIYFGHLSKEHIFVMKTKYKKPFPLLGIFPYLVLLAWILGFVSMLMWWHI